MNYWTQYVDIGAKIFTVDDFEKYGRPGLSNVEFAGHIDPYSDG